MRTEVAYGLLIFFFAVNSFCRLTPNNSTDPKAASSAEGFAVVELFTSEGCSSCPPADETVAQLLRDYENKVYVLGFHVDYWNRLGWKDVFSNSSYTKRQEQYGRQFALKSIYTPQVVVNGKAEFVGSNKTKLYTTVKQELEQTSSAGIAIDTKSNGRNVVSHYKLNNAPSSALLNIALVQLHAQNQIKSGENTGKLLHHINIVRDFKTVVLKDMQGDINLTLPEGLPGSDCKVIAFVQDADSSKILAAAESVIH